MRGVDNLRVQSVKDKDIKSFIFDILPSLSICFNISKQGTASILRFSNSNVIPEPHNIS